MSEEGSDQEVMAEIREDGEYFRRLLTLVPYLVSDDLTQEPQDNADAKNGSSQKKKKKKQKQKQNTEGNTPKGPAAQQNNWESLQGSGRRGKKRPGSAVEELQQEEETEDVDSAPLPPSKKKKKKEESKQKGKQAQSTNQTKEVPQKKKKKQKQSELKLKKQQKERVSKTVADAIHSSSHPEEDAASEATEALRQKLHHKLQEARAKKGLTLDKQQPGGDKPKKQKKKDKKKKKKKDLQNGEKGKSNKSQADGEEKTPETSSEAPPAKKPLFNIRGALMFNRVTMDYSEEKGKAGRSNLVGKDYKRILQKLETRKKKVSQLEEKDQSLAAALEDKMAWKDAISKAAGLKVKDDEALVKRSLKRKMKIKDQKKKKWRDRQKTVRKNMEAKQSKREKNIAARKESKKQTKYKKMVKKGRIIPGMHD